MSEEIPIPSQKVLINACKLSCKEDKPIMMDYWVDSLEKKGFYDEYSNELFDS